MADDDCSGAHVQNFDVWLKLFLSVKKKLLVLDATDVGKPYQSAVEHEVPRAANNIKFFADFVEQQGGETYPMGEEYLNYTRYEPVGVAALLPLGMYRLC